MSAKAAPPRKAALEALGEGGHAGSPVPDAERVGAGGRERREDREPERTADLLAGVDQSAGEARLVLADGGGAADRHAGRTRSPSPSAASERREEHVAENDPPAEIRDHQDQSSGDESSPAITTGLKPIFVTSTERDARPR